jgi:hypothetical protein
MALLTPTPAEAAASGPPRHHNSAVAARLCRSGIGHCIQQSRVILAAIDRLLVTGGDLAAVQAALDPADFTVLQNCYNALRTMVIALAPEPATLRGPALQRRDPAELTRDRTEDLVRYTGNGSVTDAARSGAKIMVILRRRCAPLLLNDLIAIDQTIVQGGGTAAIQTIMGAADHTELETCYSDLSTVLLDLDPGATIPGFNRDRSAELARKLINHPAP